MKTIIFFAILLIIAMIAAFLISQIIIQVIKSDQQTDYFRNNLIKGERINVVGYGNCSIHKIESDGTIIAKQLSTLVLFECPQSLIYPMPETAQNMELI